MNRAEMVAAVATKTSISKKAASEVIDAVLESIKEGLLTDGRVALIGFGAWEVTERSARTGRNPQTGEPMNIPAAKTVRFKAGKNFKEEIKNS